MNDQNKKTYCVYCRPGQDKAVAMKLSTLGYSSLSPQEAKTSYYQGCKEIKMRALMPGYVFFDELADLEPEWGKIREIVSVIRVLQYGDGIRALRSDDLQFINWLKQNGGAVTISPVMRVGTKIRVISGPLKYYEGSIIAVNKRRECVAVQLGNESFLQRVWFPVSYIESEEASFELASYAV